MNNANHIDPDYHHILGMSAKDRIAFMHAERWIGYPLASKILGRLLDLMKRPPKSRMENLLLVGEPNNGKTTIVRRFVNLYGAGYVNGDSDPVKSVILVESPPSADEKGLYVAILERFWAPYRATDPIVKLRHQVIHQLRNCNTRLLIIDEFHSLLTGSARKQREMMNTIKMLCNELNIPVIGVGTGDAVRVLHTDPQHASRFDVVSLPVWQPNAEFQKLLNSLEKTLPLHKPSRLSEKSLAALLHTISGGNLGDLYRLLVHCATEAINGGTEQIDEKIIKKYTWLRPTRGIREVNF